MDVHIFGSHLSFILFLEWNIYRVKEEIIVKIWNSKMLTIIMK